MHCICVFCLNDSRSTLVTICRITGLPELVSSGCIFAIFCRSCGDGYDVLTTILIHTTRKKNIWPHLHLTLTSIMGDLINRGRLRRITFHALN